MIALASVAIPVYATSSSVGNAEISGMSTRAVSVLNSLSVTQYANHTGQALGLGWLPDNVPAGARVTPVYAAALPTHFEWTSNGGYNWMTSVKNQGGCGSCVAFAAVGATEAQFKIQGNNPSWNLDLSEQHLFSCGGGTCSGGWYISSALNYLQQYGTPDESCSPYQGGSGSCSNSCPDWQSRAFKISSWSWVGNNVGAVEAALMNGPLVAGFTVYADFYYGYNGGVYHWDHVSQAVGGHAVVIVGYDQPGQYWVVKNSWGSGWGENGYFRIGFGEAGIENYVASIRALAPPVPPTPPSNSPPTVSGLTPSKSSPQVLGTTITWTASATDPEGDPILYRFWLQVGSDAWVVTQDWSSSNTWGWTPTAAGTYNVGVWIRDGKHASSSGFDARLIVNGYGVASPPSNGPPAVSSLTSGRVSPQVVGTTIAWTCSASDPEGDPILYRFWLQAGSSVWIVTQDWSSSNAWAWTPTVAGTYNVGCWVRDGKHADATGFDDRKIVNGYSITPVQVPSNGPPTVSGLTSDKASPQVVGTTVTWRSSASDPEGDPILYRFWLQAGSGAWVVTQDWSSSNSWSWSPNVAGTYNVGVWVRDGKHASSTGYDARLIVNGYSITSAPPNGPPTVSSLTPDRASPQQVGTVITWTCSATDLEGDPIQYRFWLQTGPGIPWVVTQDWSSSNAWSWTPNTPGTYNVGCWVRDGKHAGPTSFDDRKIVYGYVVPTASALIQPPSLTFLTPPFVRCGVEDRTYYPIINHQANS